MSSPAGRHLSPWLETMSPPDLGVTAFRDVAADVVVVGAGITGITTALLLQRAGRRVVVVEAEQVGRSTTTASTVKVTYGHKLLYSSIADKAGVDAASAYAQANVAGFGLLLDLAGSVDGCMLERGLPHVIYAEQPEEVGLVEREAEVAGRIGLPVSLTQEAPVPFDVAAAVAFEDQALFHPGRYLAGLAEAFVAEGGTVFEGARVRDVDEDGDICRVDTTAGQQLSAGHVVIATQYPILDRGGQFARVTARRSYGIAGVLPEGMTAGMTINVGSPTHSTRTATLEGQELLIVVGEGHPVGHTSQTAERWTRLQDWAREQFGVTEFRNHWSAQETSTLDHIPMVGFIAPGSHRVLTATGYDGWGMTNGTAAAMLIRDLIEGEHNSWAATFDARRAETSLPGKKAVKHNVHVAKTWLKDRVGGAQDDRSPQDLQPGDAAVMEVEGERTAAYRDEQGELHMVSAVCTHMGCDVAWNDGEKSWDCPCHGSRFGCDGAVLHGPATTPLPRRSPTNSGEHSGSGGFA